MNKSARILIAIIKAAHPQLPAILFSTGAFLALGPGAASAQAQETASSESRFLEEVVVTARRRS